MRVAKTKFKTTRKAIAYAKAKGMAAVLLNSKPTAVSRKQAERMEVAKVCFAYLYIHEGKVVTIPANYA